MAFFKRPEAVSAAQRAATHMIFRVGPQRYGVPMEMVAQVVAPERIAPLHGGDAAVVGEIELRGSALVVMDMGLRLQGTPIVPSPQSCVLIVRRDQARSGCLFDAADGLTRIPQGEIELSGCLVEAADGAAAIPPQDAQPPENTSSSGRAYGYPLFRLDGETILLPGEETFFPQ